MPSKVNIPDYLSDMVTGSRDAFCNVLHNPALRSDKIIKKTLERMGGQTFDINDVRVIVTEYLNCLSDAIDKGDPL